MKTSKKFFTATTIALSIALSHQAHAIPVLDKANLAQAIQQVKAWAKQYQQMAEQTQKMQQAYNNLSGIRNMGHLVNNPLARQYLPDDYQEILNNGVGQWEEIRNTFKRFELASTSLDTNSDSAQAFEQLAKQAALNRAAAEEAYKTASKRFQDIQVLLDKVNAAPDAKDIADLQARIQAEQVMMTNEANKLQMLAQLASAQKDLHNQQVNEIAMKSSKGVMPSGW